MEVRSGWRGSEMKRVAGSWRCDSVECDPAAVDRYTLG